MINYFKKEVVIIGAGPAGLAVATKLKKIGVDDILVIERESYAGGILKQCIHDGFGLKQFGEMLTGPEYANKYIEIAKKLDVEIWYGSSVISLNSNKEVTVSSSLGIYKIKAKSVVLAMGCRERTRGALAIPGERPAGVYTAGVAQSYINIYNTMIGKEVIILGSGDIGLIMARRLTLEGARVKGVYEILPYPSGLNRNIQQCLEDYSIELHLSKTVTYIHGKSRIEGVTISSVNEKLEPIEGTEEYHSCDTLVLSVGLIPENELSLEAGVILDSTTKGAVVDNTFSTNIEGVFAAGNVLHVHDVVDYVSNEAENVAKSVSNYLNKLNTKFDEFEQNINIVKDEKISYCLPQKIKTKDKFYLSLRVKKPMHRIAIVISQGEKTIKTVKFKKALPAEMIRIPIQADKFNKCFDVNVKVVEE